MENELDMTRIRALRHQERETGIGKPLEDYAFYETLRVPRYERNRWGAYLRVLADLSIDLETVKRTLEEVLNGKLAVAKTEPEIAASAVEDAPTPEGAEEAAVTPPNRKRGRPPGSKNKPKASATKG